mmetsp:Transcript_8325/g.12301  ORF Transcript_8325/g.12301 Transcript_8325/m.12301 type:complete len:537 (-) Transcript_8325:331-1941(-)
MGFVFSLSGWKTGVTTRKGGCLRWSSRGSPMCMTLGGYKVGVEMYSRVVDVEQPEVQVVKKIIKDSDHMRKMYVLDTNVILHSFQCLFTFGENDVCIPITVLEELDKFKKGNEELHYNAREFLRTLDDIAAKDSEGALAGEGIKLSDDLGRVNISLSNRDEEIEELFFQDSPDHRILATLSSLTAREKEKNFRGRNVILVTKDNNLRVKARAFGLLAQDYVTDKVPSVEEQYTGQRIHENVPSEAINVFFSNDSGAADDRLRLDMLDATCPIEPVPVPNESFILRNCSRSALATWKYDSWNAEWSFKRVDKRTAFNISPRNSEQVFAMNMLLDPSIRLVTLQGKAGTGKTLLALAAAFESRKTYAKIYLSRPVIPLSNRDSGYLPGDINTKLNPYMQPLWDNVGVIKSVNTTKQGNGKVVENSYVADVDCMIESHFLEVAPLAYIRGRSFHDAYFIVDEAQNLTPHEVKTIITRAGEGTKIVLTGDIYQIDNPYVDSRSNGLSYIVERMKGQSIYGHVLLEKGERSELADLASELL